MAEDTRLPRIGESWFTNRKIKDKDWDIFLKNPGMDIFIFKKGIPIKTLKNKLRNLLLIIQKFITCEGRFGNMFFYHAQLVMHFIDGKKINLPYFFYILRKMVANIQRKIKFIGNALHHHTLVKNLLEAHLRIKEDNWEDFLVQIRFKEAEQEEPSLR